MDSAVADIADFTLNLERERYIPLLVACDIKKIIIIIV
jgi:hypothetical protein